VIRRAAVALASLVALAAAGAASVSADAGEPMLGATVEAVIYADEDPAVSVLNRSNVPAEFRFEIDGLGWTIAEESFVLQPEEGRAVALSAIGHDEARLLVRIASPDEPAPGLQRGEILLESRLLPERPFDPLPWVLVAVLLGAIVGASVAVGRHVRR